MTKQRQFEILVEFMVQHSDLAKGHLQAANAKQTTNNLWTKLSDDLNANGPPVRDIAGWKKVRAMVLFIYIHMLNIKLIIYAYLCMCTHIYVHRFGPI